MTDRQASGLSGEFVSAPAVEVPFAPTFDLEALRKLDSDPVFATMVIKTGRGDGGRGPNYGPAVLRSLRDQVMARTPAGYRGHQNADNVAWEWRDPATTWVGAEYKDVGPDQGELYIKGYVPATARDLRDQLALASTGAGAINSVSVFGTREVDEARNEVTAFNLWSIDWTPKDRAGMETFLVGIGSEIEGAQMTDDKPITRDNVPEDVITAIAQEARDALVGELRTLLGLDDGADVLAAIADLVGQRRSTELEDRVEAALEESEVTGELETSAVRSFIVPRLSYSSSDEEIVAEIANARDLPHVKALRGDKAPVIVGAGSGGGKPSRTATSWDD